MLSNVANVAKDASGDSFIGRIWPVLLALLAWGYAFLGCSDGNVASVVASCDCRVSTSE